jgi:hypothetical protein
MLVLVGDLPGTRAFDGLKRLKAAIANANRITTGEIKETPAIETLPILLKRFTVFKKLAGDERAIAFGLTSVEAADLMAVARRRMIQAQPPNADGDPYFEATTFRTTEEV